MLYMCRGLVANGNDNSLLTKKSCFVLLLLVPALVYSKMLWCVYMVVFIMKSDEINLLLGFHSTS